MNYETKEQLENRLIETHKFVETIINHFRNGKDIEGYSRIRTLYTLLGDDVRSIKKQRRPLEVLR